MSAEPAVIVAAGSYSEEQEIGVIMTGAAETSVAVRTIEEKFLSGSQAATLCHACVRDRACNPTQVFPHI